MKQLGKLSINPEKVIKNEELVNLKGGDYGGCYICVNGRSILALQMIMSVHKNVKIQDMVQELGFVNCNIQGYNLYCNI